jgi:DNA polymerase-3 subunit beta
MGTSAKSVSQMEFTVNQADLVRELSLSQGVVEKKTTIPILSNVLIEARGEAIELTSTDLEIGVRSSCPAKVLAEGSATVPAKKFLDYVRLLDGGEVAVRLQENFWLQITAKRARTRIVGMSRENFPVLPQTPDVVARLSAGMLLDMISKVIFAVSSEESRYTLNGALLVVRPDSVIMVATDGHRLAYIEAPYQAGVSSEVRALVGKKAMGELIRLLSQQEDPNSILEFGRDESHLFFRIGGRLLISRLLSGQFPNYEAVIPKENTRVIVLDRDMIAAALRRVSQFADERSHAVKLQLAAGELKVSSSSSESGESEETLEAQYEGEAMQIGFNSQYLLDFLSATGTGPVCLEFKDEQSAGQLRPAAGDGPQYRYIVMPMRV